MSGALSLLKRANTRRFTLQHATRAAREAGLIGDADELIVELRKVTAKEMAHAVGRVPRILAAYREKRDDESNHDFAKRMGERATEDPELYAALTEQMMENTRGLAINGVTGVGVIRDGVDDIEPVTLGLTGDATPEAVLGADLDDVAQAITDWSSSGMTPKEGGGDKLGTFPSERPGDPVQPDSARVGHDADGVHEPTTS